MDIILLNQTSSEVSHTAANSNPPQEWMTHLGDWVMGFLPHLISAVIIFLAGWWIIKLICKIISKALGKTKADTTVVSFLESLIGTALKVVLIICVLSTLGFDMTTIITTVGAAAVTIGLALKDSLANVASGTLIILNKKFKIGDYLETEGLKGKVVNIGMMYTTLCTYDNKEILIPNSRLTSNNIINYFVQEERRIDLIVPIAYSEDISKAREVIMELINHHDLVIKEKRNRVAVQTLNESSVDLSVWIWCRSEDYWNVLEEMQESIKNSLDAHHITIPFNQMDVHLIGEKAQPIRLVEEHTQPDKKGDLL